MDLEKTLVPNVKFLESCGIPMKQIVNHIYFFPRFLLHKPEVLRKCVDKVDEMRVSRSSKSFIYAVRIVRSFGNVYWELKLKAFRDVGFSETDILKMFRTSSPGVYQCKGEDEDGKRVILASGKYDMSSIVHYPVSLMYNIEKRYEVLTSMCYPLETNVYGRTLKKFVCLMFLVVVPYILKILTYCYVIPVRCDATFSE